MRSAEKRDEIMQVTMELLAEKGFHGVPMSLIAERAKVAIGTIYLYFPCKDALIDAVYREVEKRLIATLALGEPAGKPVRERFLHLTGELLRYLVANPLEFRYIEQYFNSPYGISLRRDRFSQQARLADKAGDRDLLADLFTAGIADRSVKDLPLVVLFSLATAPLIFLARDHILGFVDLDAPLIQRTTEACWDAIRR